MNKIAMTPRAPSRERAEKRLRLIADKLDLLNGRARIISMEELRQGINWAVKDIWAIADDIATLKPKEKGKK